MDGQLLSETFVELTDTMVAGFDVIDFLHVLTDRSVQLLDVSAAGLLLADPRGELRVVAASSEAARLLELFQIQNDQGPCLDCFRTGRPVHAADLAAAARRWPRFATAACLTWPRLSSTAQSPSPARTRAGSGSSCLATASRASRPGRARGQGCSPSPPHVAGTLSAGLPRPPTPQPGKQAR